MVTEVRPSSNATVLDDISLPPIPAGMLAGHNRRQRADKLHESINLAYYRKPNGDIQCVEGPETEQGKRLMSVKGWTLIRRSPRPAVNAELNAPYHALLRTQDGPSLFRVEQIIEFRWHQPHRAPVIFTCRQPLDDLDHPQHGEECFKRVVFPQLRGLRVHEATCRICRAYFASVEDSDMMHAEVQLKKHMEVSHKAQLANQELVEGLTSAFRSAGMMNGAANGGGMTADAVAQIAATVALSVVERLVPGLTANVSETPSVEVQSATCGHPVGNGTCVLPGGHPGVHKLHVDSEGTTLQA